MSNLEETPDTLGRGCLAAGFEEGGVSVLRHQRVRRQMDVMDGGGGEGSSVMVSYGPENGGGGVLRSPLFNVASAMKLLQSVHADRLLLEV